ncbi:uncharacterized protein BJ171DRAFT_425860, partial [Polychytrium aggregatum]|uniref:uncharacterized protein n=1 Tax=Polychytrium aggregatum TaxID=110093 RepID=UPI0022FF1B8D
MAKKPSTKKSVLLEEIFSGAIGFLESCPGVHEVKLCSRNNSLSSYHFLAWERDHPGIALPSDLKAFLQITDGILLGWSVKFSHQEAFQLGAIHINALERLVRVDSPRRTADGSALDHPYFQPLSKPPGPSFVLQECRGYGRVCLCYMHTPPRYNYSPSSESLKDDPAQATGTTGTAGAPQPDGESRAQPVVQVWFQETKPGEGAGSWFRIAKSFTAYFRLMIEHMGIHGWQLAFTDSGLPPAVLDWMCFYVPARAKMYRQHR